MPYNIDTGPVSCNRTKVTSSSLPTLVFVKHRLVLSLLRSLRLLRTILGVRSLSGMKLPGSNSSGNSSKSRS